MRQMNIVHHSKLFGHFLFSVEKVILTYHFIEKNICMLCMHCFYVHVFLFAQWLLTCVFYT